MPDLSSERPRAETGLRDRKKAKRRDEIIAAARRLFATQGIDATTMADIAALAEISAPTVFNYFGSKDGVLIALIGEGTRKARESDRHLHWREGTDLADLILKLFLRVSEKTLDLADKQVWRYAEAAAIRNPETELAREYNAVSQALVDVVIEFFDGLDLRMRTGSDGSSAFIGRLFHDVWMPCFIHLITNEDETLGEHETMLRQRIATLVHLLFEDGIARKPNRKPSRKKDRA